MVPGGRGGLEIPGLTKRAADSGFYLTLENDAWLVYYSERGERALNDVVHGARRDIGRLPTPLSNLASCD